MKSVRALVLAFLLPLFSRGQSGLYRRRRSIHPGRSVRGWNWSDTKDIARKCYKLCMFVVLVLSLGPFGRARSLIQHGLEIFEILSTPSSKIGRWWYRIKEGCD
jgi:hypothetical protein